MEIGETVERNGIRAHRFTDLIQVTELANAGKRGKVCRYFSGVESFGGVFVLGELGRMVDDGAEFDALRAQAQASCSVMWEREIPAVDVAPAGFQTIEINGAHVAVSAGFDTFCVRDLDDANNEPTLIPPSKGRKTAVKRFYKLASAYRDEIKGMTFRQVEDAMQTAGIDSHYYCARD